MTDAHPHCLMTGTNLPLFKSSPEKIYNYQSINSTKLVSQKNAVDNLCALQISITNSPRLFWLKADSIPEAVSSGPTPEGYQWLAWKLSFKSAPIYSWLSIVLMPDIATKTLWPIDQYARSIAESVVPNVLLRISSPVCLLCAPA